MSRTIMRSGLTYDLHVSSQEPPSMSSKSLMMMGSSLHSFNHARMLKFGTQVRNPMSRTIMRSRMILVLQVSSQEASMSSNNNHDRKLKFGTHVRNHI